MLNLIHVTHEAVHKVGGIGAVLEGLICSPAYGRQVNRTILLCPLFTTEGTADSRLGPAGEVLYSSIDGRTDHPHQHVFREIQQQYHVEIVYGRRWLREPQTGREEWPEVLLIDVSRASVERTNGFKWKLHEAYGLDSRRFEQSWDYEEYVRLAEPGLAAARAIGATTAGARCVVLGHEFMGLPTALAAKLHPEWGMKAVYYAHEVPTIRKIVEEHPGHDAMFYNVLSLAEAKGLHSGDVFGEQGGYYRHALVLEARHLDAILAVGDYVVRELRFLDRRMSEAKIHLTYNGIPSPELSAESAAESKRRLQDYTERLLGYRPDYVFTHVTRMSPSKGLWRDIRVMHRLEEALRRMGRTAVLIVLSTELGGPRKGEEVLQMEKGWNWPVAHREKSPDLTGGEAHYYAGVQGFNARSRNSKILYVNQFGFDRASCGQRMPEEMQFVDIRRGSEVEFGQSTYEPFGIAQVEAMAYGSVCVIGSVCGCASFALHADAGRGSDNILIADYAGRFPGKETIGDYLAMTKEEREAREDEMAGRIASTILERLPDEPGRKRALLQRGHELAQAMSWDVIAEEYLLPVLEEITARRESAAAVGA